MLDDERPTPMGAMSPRGLPALRQVQTALAVGARGGLLQAREAVCVGPLQGRACRREHGDLTPDVRRKLSACDPIINDL